MALKRTSLTPPSYPATADLPTIFVPAPPRPKGRGWRVMAVLLFLFITAVIGLGLALGVFAYQADLIMPGVRVLGVHLGTQSRAEAAYTLQTHWQEQVIVLTAADSMWLTSPQELGISLDIDATVQRAYEQGRSFDSLLDVILNGQTAAVPVWQMDTTAAENYLQQVAPQFEKAPVNAGVEIINGQAQATTPQTGQTLNVEATMAWLLQHGGEAVLDGRLPLVVESVEPAVFDVSGAVARANQLLALTLNVHGYDPVQDETLYWTITPGVWGDWVTMDPLQPGQAEHFSWTLDESKVAATLAKSLTIADGRFLDADEVVSAVTQATLVGNSAVNVRIFHPERSHIVQSGETLSSIGRSYGVPYPWIQQANPSIGDAMSVGQTLIIPSPDELLPLPVVENKRIVISLSQQKVWVYENGSLKWEWLVSTGISSSPTSPGIFQIQSHETNAYAGNWDLWMPSFMGIYRPVPTSDFMNGFHGFPTRSGRELLWTGDLGHEVTYGCVLLSSENADLLFNWAEEGVVVEIQS
jgi:lipoprotein-anchoring transpeptidase ErfK/SrfK